ncbi:MAG: DUF3179 domain-containing protein [Jiangellaceae bacterium]
MIRRRLIVVVAAAATAGLVVTALATTGGDGDADPDAGSGGGAASVEPVALPQAEVSAREAVPSALQDLRDPAFPDPLLDPTFVLSGGPPPDGIPAIDAPTFLRAQDVGFLADTEAILALTVGDDTRGYPFQIMTWHEIVNDTVGGVPVAVTYCPLCNSGVAFDRRVDGKVLDFGTSGMLHASNLIMYDRQTESLWPQLSGQAAIGVMTGATMDVLPLSPVGWAEFRAAHPDAWVLSRNTGHVRDYGRNPYVGLDRDPDRPPTFGAPSDDDRLPPMERVIALQGSSETVTVVRSAVEEARVVDETLDDRPLVLLHAVGQASALDDGLISGGRDIGTVAVFDPVVDGMTLSFGVDGAGFVDEQTGSTWNILGEATAGELAGERLTPYPFLDTFWLSWVAFAPDTRIARD